MIPALDQLWRWLTDVPLFWPGVTLCAFETACWIRTSCNGSQLANPVLLGTALLAVLLVSTGTPYQIYFDGARPIHLLLGPATVALAVPLYRNLGLIRDCAPAILSALVAGSAVAAGSAVGLAWLFGADRSFLLSIAPKSVSTPIAVGISEQIGGHPSLTAILVIATGVTGAMIGTKILDRLGIEDWRLRGVAVGVSAHGIGTAAILPQTETGGAFASLAMGLNGLLTALLLPIIVHWFAH